MVLELGAGIGLVAIAAAEASRVVVATDCDTVFIALATCKRNAARHHRAVRRRSMGYRNWSMIILNSMMHAACRILVDQCEPAG